MLFLSEFDTSIIKLLTIDHNSMTLHCDYTAETAFQLLELKLEYDHIEIAEYMRFVILINNELTINIIVS